MLSAILLSLKFREHNPTYLSHIETGIERLAFEVA
jgi:hypothetical protein